MIEIVSRVQELADLADSALPRAGEVAGLADSSETQLLVALSALRARVDASLSLVAADIERKSARELGAAGLARRSGVKTGIELVQKLTGVSRADAARAVRTGEMFETAEAVAPAPVSAANEPHDPQPRTLAALAALAGAWDAPIAVAIRNQWLSIDQGDALRRGLGSPRAAAGGDAVADAQWRDAGLRLIELCWDGDLTPEDAKKHATQLRSVLDREWAAGNAERLREQRSLRRVVRADGMVKYDLLVDPLTDAEIWTPLFRHLAPRLGGPRFMTAEEQARAAELEADARSNEQLLADAFTGFLIAGVSGSGVVGAYVPTVNIAVSSTDLRTAVKADEMRRNGQRPESDGIGWLDGRPEPITGAQILTAICSGDHLATLFDDTGQALDVTRHERTFSARQRKAMALRDGGCLIPGCTMPPTACEGHHIFPWSHGPQNHRTETRDGVLLCRFHHLNLHNQGGRIERRGSDYWLHWPRQAPIRLVPKHGVAAQLRHARETEHDDDAA